MINTYIGNSETKNKIYRIPAPDSTAVSIEFRISTKELVFDEWSTGAIIAGFSDTKIPEFKGLDLSVDSTTGDLLIESRNGEDFILTVGMTAVVSVTSVQEGANPVNQKIEVELPEVVTSGTWDLSIDFGSGYEDLDDIAYNVTSAALQADIASTMASASTGDVLIQKPSSNKFVFEIGGSLAGTSVTIIADGTNLVGQAQAVVETTVETGTNIPEVWLISQPLITVSGGGDPGVESFTYKFNGVEYATLMEGFVGLGCSEDEVTITDYLDGILIAVLTGDSALVDIVSIRAIAESTSGSSTLLQAGGGSSDNSFFFKNLGETGLPTDLEFDGETYSGVDGFLSNHQTGYEGLSTVGSDNVELSIHTIQGNQVLFVEFIGDLGNQDIAQDLTNLTRIHAGSAVPNEVQEAYIKYGGGGTFTIDFDGEETSNITYGSDASTVQTAMEALSNMTSGDVVILGAGIEKDPYVFEFTGDYKQTDVPLLIFDVSSVNGGPLDQTVISTPFAGQNDIQRVSLSSDTSSGDFSLSLFTGTSDLIEYDFTATEFKTALTNISELTSSNLSVSESGDKSWDIEFIDNLAKQNIPPIIVSRNNLSATGSGITISLEQEATGRQWANNPDNWSLNRCPDTGDDIVFEKPDLSVEFGYTFLGSFTVDTDANTLELDGQMFVDDQAVRVKTSDTLPDGLAADVDYYVINSNRYNGTFQLSTTLGGSVVSITDAGTGTHTVGVFVNSIEHRNRANGVIGLADRNTQRSLSFEEYRPRYFKIGVLASGDKKAVFGVGDGPGAGRLKFDFGDDDIDIKVLETAGSLDNSVPALLFLLNNDSIELDVDGGSVGVSVMSGQTFSISGVKVQGGTVHLGEGVIDKFVEKTGGDIFSAQTVMSTGAYWINR